ncbi:helix-turn-helix domain-containing protein [Streptomyces sp. NPDC054904]
MLPDPGITEVLGWSWPSRKWRRWFLRDRLAGLEDEPRPGRPRGDSDDQVGDLIARTLESTPENVTHRSTPSMARTAGLSKSTVSRVWGGLRSPAAPLGDVQAVDRSLPPARQLRHPPRPGTPPSRLVVPPLLATDLPSTRVLAGLDGGVLAGRLGMARQSQRTLLPGGVRGWRANQSLGAHQGRGAPGYPGTQPRPGDPSTDRTGSIPGGMIATGLLMDDWPTSRIQAAECRRRASAPRQLLTCP